MNKQRENFMLNWQSHTKGLPVHSINLKTILAKLYSLKCSVIAKKRQYLVAKISQMRKKVQEKNLIKTIQQNHTLAGDKMRSYLSLYKLYNYDVDKILSVMHNNVTKQTLQKYIKIGKLPDKVLQLLDKNNENHISNDVAIELTKLPKHIDPMEVLNSMTTLTNKQKIHAIKQWKPTVL